MSKRILIVDDDEQVVGILVKQLEANGYKTLTANNGADGLQLAKKENPDLLLLDLAMPVMDGKTVCRIIKSDPETRHIRIIMLSGDKLVGDMEDSFSFGAEAYVNKPYDLTHLLAHIKGLIG